MSKVKGRHEVIHNLVSCGTVGWLTEGEREQHEILFPPVTLQSTTAEQIGAGLCHNFEQHLTTVSWPTLFQQISGSFGAVHFNIVADSAAPNLKLVRHMLQFLCKAGEQAGLCVTGVFLPCLLHQVSRIIVVALDRNHVSAPLYSVSRLNQHTVLREKTWKSLHDELHRRFRWIRGPPPNENLSSPAFRRPLLQLLAGNWQTSEEPEMVASLLNFFNGDLRDPDNWYHYCSEGCCSSRRESLSKARAGISKLRILVEPVSPGAGCFAAWQFGIL